MSLFEASKDVRIDVRVPVANEKANTPPIIKKIASTRSVVLVA